ncbi:tetratricopeptide repeat protein, partial [Streptomyces hainanensis]
AEGAPADPPRAGRTRVPDPADVPLGRAFALVHTALPAPSARMLRLLALAPAGLVDAHLAAALVGCPVPAARATLAELTAFGLLRPAGQAGADGLPDQYRVPGCLEGRIAALLAALERPGEAVLARARMLERVVTRLRACQAVTEQPTGEEREWLAALPAALRFDNRAAAAGWLVTRRPALLAAARTAATDGGLDTLARRLLATLSRVLIAHLSPDQARAELYGLQELALLIADRQRLTRERAAALLSLGDLDAGAGRPRAALDRYRAALEAARGDRGPRQEGVDADDVRRALESVADTYAELGEWQRAADWYGRALPMSQARGDLAGVGRLHGRVGAALAHTGQWGEALRAWRAAAAAHRRHGDVPAQARALAEVARAQERVGRPEEALRTGSDALRLAEHGADLRLRAELRLRLADCADRLGRADAAAAHRAAAERLTAEAAAAEERPAATAPTFGTQTPSAND